MTKKTTNYLLLGLAAIGGYLVYQNKDSIFGTAGAPRLPAGPPLAKQDGRLDVFTLINKSDMARSMIAPVNYSTNRIEQLLAQYNARHPQTAHLRTFANN